MFDLDDLKFLVHRVYVQGLADGHDQAAADAEAADLNWRLRRRVSYNERVAERVAEMQAARARMWPGRPEYLGGPVAWEMPPVAA